MIDLYYWPTPNGHKVSIALEELALPYTTHLVNIGTGEQFRPEFLAHSPNNRIPAIVDGEPLGGGAPMSIFESGAILLYLGQKTGRLVGNNPREHFEIVQWVMWQMAGLGPMSGQAFHFGVYANEKIPYAIDRYTKEVNRLYGVLDRRLADREYIAGDYSMADIAVYPWMLGADKINQVLADFPDVVRWMASIKARPAVERGLDVGKEARKPLSEEAKKVLFQQTAATVAEQQKKPV